MELVWFWSIANTAINACFVVMAHFVIAASLMRLQEQTAAGTPDTRQVLLEMIKFLVFLVDYARVFNFHYTKLVYSQLITFY